MTRGRVALAVLGVWAVAVGLLVSRSINRDPVEVLAIAALRIQPRSLYYTIEYEGRIVGAASSEIDTLPSSIVATDYVEGVLPAADTTADLRVRARSTFSRALSFQDIRILVQPPGDSVSVTITRASEELLRATGARGGQMLGTQEIEARDPVFMPQWAALPLMLTQDPRQGAGMRVRILDPRTRIARETPLLIAAESLFVVVDSARFDPGGRVWVPALLDTIRAWRVTGDGLPPTFWIDVAGRIVEAEDERGLVLRRTAYEIALENWRRSRMVTPAPAARPSRTALPSMIQLRSLTKRYGKFTAVDSIDLTVARGEIFGFLGPNGAGKTTTLRMIAGILLPTAGTVLIGDVDVVEDPLLAKAKLGYIPDRPFIYEKLTGSEFLRFVAGLYDQQGEDVDHRARELLALFDLEDWRDEFVESYSHGMRQKIII
ncbi:hypothetical protein BH23GEM1_BH23GEM1_08240 [soil metagenome]